MIHAFQLSCLVEFWGASPRSGCADGRLLRELSATLSSKLYQNFRMKYTLIQKNINQRSFIEKQVHPRTGSSQDNFIQKQLSSFIQKHIVNVQPNALPWTGLAPDPPCPRPSKISRFFPLPTFSSHLTFNIMWLFVDLCWWFGRFLFFFKNHSKHIWAFWTPNLALLR